MIKKYEIIECVEQVPVRKKFRKRIKEIVQGCTTYCEFPETLCSFDTLDQAREKFFKDYSQSYVKYYQHTISFYEVTEYFLTEVHYEDDGEYLEQYGSWEISEMPEFED